MSSQKDVERAVAGEMNQPENNPWPQRLEQFKKFSEKFHERGCKIEMRYEDDRSDMMMGGKRVNMFYSNVTIIKESLYNSLPKPTASRMHKGDWDNDAARVAATIAERCLTYEINCAPGFDDSIKSAILDRLVPGFGVLWVNFNDASGNVPEHLTLDIVYWKDFIFEPARNWQSVTWAGRKLHVSPDVAKSRWGDAAVPAEIPASKGASSETTINEGKVCVIQMWDKVTKKVVHLTPEGKVLNSVDDPYKLKGFFPFPKPLVACPSTRQFLPMADFYMAQDQYTQLDELYARISLIIDAIQVSGVYDSATPAIGRMISEGKNQLIPCDNWAMFAEGGGLKGKIDWYPVEQIATVLTHLVSTFSFIKNQLFEVTGMADIVRGSSNQYETAAAQQIKAQFASVRMNGFQRDVSFFVRDTIRIMSELQTQLYTEEKLSKICGLLPEVDQQFVAEALKILRDDFLSSYNVDIQPDSLTQADWSLQQDQRMAYAQSLSQFFTAALPVVESKPELASLMVQVIKFMSVGFKGSSELEGVLDQTLQQIENAPPPEPPQDPEAIKAQAEAQKIEQETQQRQQEFQQKSIERQQEAEFERQEREEELQFRRQMNAMEMEHEQRLFELKTNQMVIEGVIKAESEAKKAESAQAQHEGEEDRKNASFVAEQTRADESSKAEIARTDAKAASAKPKPTSKRK